MRVGGRARDIGLLRLVTTHSDVNPARTATASSVRSWCCGASDGHATAVSRALRRRRGGRRAGTPGRRDRGEAEAAQAAARAMLRGRALPPGRAVGRPGARRDHAADVVDDVERHRAASGSRSRATRTSARSWRAQDILTSGARSTTRSRRAYRPASRTSATGTASRRATATRPVGRFQTALPAGLPRDRALRLLLLRRLHARLLQRLRAAGARGPRLRRLPRRLHLRRDATTPRSATGARCATTRSASANPTTPRIVREAARSPSTAPSTRSTAATRPCATLHADVPDDRHLGRPRGPEQLRERRRRTAA